MFVKSTSSLSSINGQSNRGDKNSTTPSTPVIGNQSQNIYITHDNKTIYKNKIQNQRYRQNSKNNNYRITTTSYNNNNKKTDNGTVKGNFLRPQQQQYQLQQQSFNNNNNSNIINHNNNSHSKNLIEITGMTQDPEFQKMKAIVLELESQSIKQNRIECSTLLAPNTNAKNIVSKNGKGTKTKIRLEKDIVINEQPYQVDYDNNKRQLKRSRDTVSLNLLPRLKEYKCFKKQERPAYIVVNNQIPYFSIKDFAEKEYKGVNFQNVEKKYQLQGINSQNNVGSNSLINNSHIYSQTQNNLNNIYYQNNSNNITNTSINMNNNCDSKSKSSYNLQYQHHNNSSHGQLTALELFKETKDKAFSFIDIRDNYRKKTFRIVFELYSKIAPMACDNFMALCEGFIDKKTGQRYSYSNTKIQRLRPYFFFQAGHFGDNFQSIFGGLFKDECFTISHLTPGILGCANQGRPHTNSSSFYVTMDKMEGLDKKGVAFGRVLEGLKDILKINKNYSDKTFDMDIINSGRYNLKINENFPIKNYDESLIEEKNNQQIILNSPERDNKEYPQLSQSHQTTKQHNPNNLRIDVQNMSSSQDSRCSRSSKRNSSYIPRNSSQSQRSLPKYSQSQFQISSPLKSPSKTGNRSRKQTKSGKNSIFLNRSHSLESVVTDFQDQEQDEEQIIQFRKELFSFNSFKYMKEPETHHSHLEKYSEKFTLGQDFNDLMLAIEKTCLQVKKILRKSYKYEDLFDLEQEITETFIENVTECGSISLIYNTKTDVMTKVPSDKMGRFIIAFNPLDISDICDIDQCGFMWLVMKKTSSSYRPPTKNDYMQQGDKIDCAGYCLYGPATQLIYHAGFRVNIYTLDEQKNVFNLTFNNIKAPKRKGIISIDTSQLEDFNQKIRLFHKRRFESVDQYFHRYTGSRISDFHRTMLYGGVMLCPMSEQNKNEGGMNFLEAFIFSYIMEKAWESSSTGEEGSILFKKPADLQQRVNLYLGCGSEISELENLYLEIRRQKSVFQSIQSKTSILQVK